jgi:hypothetical protein
MTRYWLWWFLLTFPVGFLIPETIALVRNRTQDTLSGAIWNLEKLQPGQGITKWTAAHLLFTGVFVLVTAWLVGHFGWGLWR